jgi:hypothetical protein
MLVPVPTFSSTVVNSQSLEAYYEKVKSFLSNIASQVESSQLPESESFAVSCENIPLLSEQLNELQDRLDNIDIQLSSNRQSENIPSALTEEISFLKQVISLQEDIDGVEIEPNLSRRAKNILNILNRLNKLSELYESDILNRIKEEINKKKWILIGEIIVHMDRLLIVSVDSIELLKGSVPYLEYFNDLISLQGVNKYMEILAKSIYANIIQSWITDHTIDTINIDLVIESNNNHIKYTVLRNPYKSATLVINHGIWNNQFLALMQFFKDAIFVTSESTVTSVKHSLYRWLYKLMDVGDVIPNPSQIKVVNVKMYKILVKWGFLYKYDDEALLMVDEVDDKSGIFVYIRNILLDENHKLLLLDITKTDLYKDMIKSVGIDCSVVIPKMITKGVMEISNFLLTNKISKNQHKIAIMISIILANHTWHTIQDLLFLSYLFAYMGYPIPSIVHIRRQAESLYNEKIVEIQKYIDSLEDFHDKFVYIEEKLVPEIAINKWLQGRTVHLLLLYMIDGFLKKINQSSMNSNQIYQEAFGIVKGSKVLERLREHSDTCFIRMRCISTLVTGSEYQIADIFNDLEIHSEWLNRSILDKLLFANPILSSQERISIKNQIFK